LAIELPALMRRFIQEVLVVVIIFCFGGYLQGQNIDFTLRYDATTSKYEVYGRPDFDDPFFFVGGGNQISLVFPASVEDSPIAVQTVNGGLWLDNSQVYAPTADPSHDFHSIASNGSGVSFVNGEELLLFTFMITGTSCVAGIRLFENASDPQSNAPGMGGGDFNNYFANVFDFQDYYQSNYDNEGTICLTPPQVDPDNLVVPQDSFNTICMTIFDPNVGDTFTYSMCSPAPANGTAVLSGSGNQLCVTYTPFAGYIGMDEVCVTVCDQTGLCSSSMVPVDVVPDDCLDTDGDGICDVIDNCVFIVNPDQSDCDNDGAGDLCELDTDGDSVPDDCDICTGDDATGDTDEDGICDNIDNCVFIANPDQSDCDNDGEGDLCELDTDGDSVPDDCDICTGDDGTGDMDGDGICDDIDNCILLANPDQFDCDDDGEGDLCELDTDGDSVPDDCDVCTGDDATGDTDGDGVCDDIDNCVLLVNPGQEDCDDDGEGNICEEDDDNDGVPNGCDTCLGDDATGDTDGDGICDDIDNCISIVNPAQTDCDNDGVGDLCEVDSDGDSVPDDCDVCDGNDAFGDDDGDGICNDIPDCFEYQLEVSNDGVECVQPFTDINLVAVIIGEHVNYDLFRFNWFGENNFSSSNRNAILPNIQNVNSGTYTVSVTNILSGCEYVTSTVVDVTVIPDQPQILASADFICVGNEMVLSIPEYSGTDVQYEWFGPNGTTGSGAYPDQATLNIPDFTPNDAGAYQVMVTVDECSSLRSSVANIKMQPRLIAPQITGTAEVCAGGVISLQTEVIADQYIWSGPNGFTADVANPSITISANTQHEGTYNLLIVKNGCTSPVRNFTVNLSEPPATPILELSNNICFGDDIELSIVNPDAASYQWIPPSASPNSSFGELGDPDNVTWTTAGNTSISQNLNSPIYEPGIWRVQALNELGCVSETSIPQSLNFIRPPNAAIVSSEGDVCENAPVYLHANPITDVTFYWYDGDPSSSTASILVAVGNDPILFNVPPGLHQYYVKAEQNDCSSATSSQVEVIVKEKPVLNAINNPVSFCQGETIQLEAPEISGATYHWYGQNGFTSNARNPVISQGTVEAEGTYLLYVEVNGCASDPVTTEVIMSPEIAVPIAINNGPVCIGDDLLLSVSNLNPDLTYEWFDSIGSVSVGAGAELLFENVETDISGTYYVVASSEDCSSDPSQTTSSGEDAFSQVVIEVADSDAAYVGDPLFACENSIVINALASTTGTGIWSLLEGGPNTTILQPGQPSSLVINLQEGINELVWSVTSNSCGTVSTDTLQIEWGIQPTVVDDLVEIEYNESLNDLIVFDNDTPNTNDFEISIVTDVENGSLLLLGDNVLAYWPEEGFIGTETFEYRLCHKNCPELCDEGLVTIRVAIGEDCEAASVFTPNRDGFNDTFIITCVPNFPGSSLSIFNRWGNEVYANPDYQNNWEGTFDGNPLPAGTYFYFLELNDGEGTKMQGYIYLER